MIRLSRLPDCPDVVMGFVGFHQHIDPVRNTLSLFLARHFPVVIAECGKGEVPDFLFFSVFAPDGHFAKPDDAPERDPRYDRCVKIFACEENLRPPWDACHYAITPDRLVEPAHAARHLRWPNHANYVAMSERNRWRSLVKPAGYDAQAIRRQKKRFCNFIYSNPGPRERKLFFEMLSRYKKVDSGGAVLNNLGYRVRDKCAFLGECKFTIAFENSRFPGYISEKLPDAMAMDTLPIYWGDRFAAVDFNPKSFIDANEPEGMSLEKHFAKIVDEIAWLDAHDDAYDARLAEPWFQDNQLNACCASEYLVPFMRKLFEREPSQ